MRLTILIVLLSLLFTSCFQKDYQKEMDKAKTYRISGQYEKAEMILNQLLKMKKTKEAYKELGNVYLTGYNDLSRAEIKYKQSLEIDSNYVNSIHNMGLVYLKRFENSMDHKGNGNTSYLEKSKEWFKKALEVNPDFYLTHVEYAKAFYYERNYKEAIEYLEKAIPLNSSYAPIYSVKGQIYLKGLNDINKALYNLKKSYGLDPNNIENIYFLAICYGEAKDKENFVYFFDKYIQMLEQKKVDSKIIDDYKKEKEQIMKKF